MLSDMILGGFEKKEILVLLKKIPKGYLHAMA